jgi:hypothetical protein
MQNANVPVDELSQGGIRGHLTEAIKSLFMSATAKLKGSERRIFMTETVRKLGAGGQTLEERARMEPWAYPQRNARAHYRHRMHGCVLPEGAQTLR